MYRNYKKVTIQGIELDYLAPGLSQMPFAMQWIIKGFAPTFMTALEIQGLNAREVFDASVKYVQDLQGDINAEEERASAWGNALLSSDATLDFLYPVLSQSFPTVDLVRINNEALNEILSIFFTDFFAIFTSE